ncbi:hypothetical protein TrLO_g11063 [Triparma laevis f. longispina]|uniref:Uncharacterized protein n=1 Tax=Triparma laevis f. longispina TaxID=1714387 RepID=A0A9W7KVA4_9STRA|nr:hypothetical protein TrLO_g11063 [Triparma laevis f. longispina]
MLIARDSSTYERTRAPAKPAPVSDKSSANTVQGLRSATNPTSKSATKPTAKSASKSTTKPTSDSDSESQTTVNTLTVLHKPGRYNNRMSPAIITPELVVARNSRQLPSTSPTSGSR